MHQMANYHRFVLWKKPQEKRAIGREIAIFPIMWKMAVFRKMAKGRQRESLPNGLFFEATLKGEKNT